MLLTPGRKLGQYEILAPLGAGGMGEVYRARDTKLGREVAIKVLPEAFARQREKLARFEREARLLAALNHPNIATLHGFEEVEGIHFLVMELVPGETLADRLAKGPLPLDEAQPVMRQIAEALEAAHQEGIIHRDLKPANIKVTPKGRVKVLDFGLAKAYGRPSADLSESPTLTREGTVAGAVLGTAPYMSPEQARGKPLDKRTDIWSFGCVFYEALTARNAFAGETVPDIIGSILRDDPDWQALPKTTPERIRSLLARCLQKDPHERLRDIAEARIEIDRASAPGQATSLYRFKPWLLAAAGLLIAFALFLGYLNLKSKEVAPEPKPVAVKGISGRKMIIVLPFEHLGPSEEQGFTAGITMEIHSRLSAVPSLGVISRTTAVQYDLAGKTLQQIGEELGVEYVLEGTVLWEEPASGASRVRVHFQLVQVSDDTPLWSGSYERELAEVFRAQSEIAGQVIQGLEEELLEPEQAVRGRPTDDLEAYQTYLQGLDHLYVVEPGRTRSAAIKFEQALELDPDFMAAQARLAQALVLLEPARAEEMAKRTLEVAPDLPEAHLAMGWYHYRVERDDDRALEELQIAEKDLPNDWEIALVTAFIHRRRGRYEEAIYWGERAAILQPNDPSITVDLGTTFWLSRRFEEADFYWDRTITLAPNQEVGYYGYLLRTFNYYAWEKTTETARRLLESAPQSTGCEITLAWTLLEWLDRNYATMAERTAATSEEYCGIAAHGYYMDFLAALAYQRMNEPGKARALLESVRTDAENWVEEFPQSASGHSNLGLVYAALGRNDEAVQEGLRAVELWPTSEDAFQGPEFVLLLAKIYAMVGEQERALDQLEYLHSLDIAILSMAPLHLDPAWDPLRENPRFQDLMSRIP